MECIHTTMLHGIPVCSVGESGRRDHLDDVRGAEQGHSGGLFGG